MGDVRGMVRADSRTHLRLGVQRFSQENGCLSDLRGPWTYTSRPTDTCIGTAIQLQELSIGLL